jgi:hypothetical protein
MSLTKHYDRGYKINKKTKQAFKEVQSETLRIDSRFEEGKLL